METPAAGRISTGDPELDRLLSEDGERVPEAVRALDAGDQSAKGRASHAFAQMSRTVREQNRIIEEQNRRMAEVERKQKESETKPSGIPGVPPEGTVDLAEQALGGLARQAMANLGIPIVKTLAQQELVKMEMQRLYTSKAAEAESRTRLIANAPQVVAEKLAKFVNLSDEDREEAIKRLEKVDPSARVEDSVIRSVVATVLGEKRLAEGAGSSSTGTEEDRGEDGDEEQIAPAPRGPSAEGRAAVSQVRTEGRKGVKISTPPGKGGGDPKPLTPDEVAEMRKLGLTDAKAYRAAKQIKSKYAGQSGIS